MKKLLICAIACLFIACGDEPKEDVVQVPVRERHDIGSYAETEKPETAPIETPERIINSEIPEHTIAYSKDPLKKIWWMEANYYYYPAIPEGQVLLGYEPFPSAELKESKILDCLPDCEQAMIKYALKIGANYIEQVDMGVRYEKR